VIGIYNAELGGLIPRKSSGPINRLLRGTAAELAATERGKAIRYSLGGLLGLVIVHAFIYLAIVAPG
jgi:hypothetical protein